MAGSDDQPLEGEAQIDLLQQFQAQQWQSWAEAERERRQRALRALAQQAVVTPGASSVSGPHHVAPQAPTISLAPPRRRASPRWLLIVSAALLVAGVGAAALHALPFISQQRATQPVPVVRPHLTIVPSAKGLGCVQDAAWSADGSRIAVLGYQPDAAHPCPIGDPFNYAYEPGLVVIYSAATGALLTKLSPDRTIIPALHLKPPRLPALPSTMPSDRGDTSQQVITYTRVLWSADGSRLALLFSIDRFSNIQIQSDGSASYDTVATDGMLAASLMGGPGETLLGPALDPTDSSTPTTWEWDLANGRYIPVPAPIASIAEPAALPQALGYTWNANGTLTPQQPLTSGGVPRVPALGPVGNPAGDASFTIWQPGHIAPDSQWGPGVYRYQTRIVTWSPDGRYLYPSTSGDVGGELQVPATYGLAPQDLAAVLPPPEPLLPLRDKALGAVMSHGYFGDVAWSPDGRQLAMVREQGTPTRMTGVDIDHVQLYDCTSGAELATLVQDLGQNVPASVAIRWSPDSTRVFVVGIGIDTISVWTVPKAA